MVHLNDADGLISGTIGRYHKHLEYIDNVLGSQASGQRASLSALVIEGKPLFMADTYLNVNPTADELVHIVNMAVEQMRHFGVEPKVALLSHSNFGSSNSESAIKMRAVLQQLLEQNIDFEVDGEMHADMAFSETLRSRFVTDSRLKGSANLLIMPNVESANIAYNLAKALGGHLGIGPMLLGLNHTAHILTPSTTTRGVFNMSSLAIVEAKEKRGLV
jgi:malate dehydrogenase (oxaloacetate-decarboxylating)(NADP+)